MQNGSNNSIVLENPRTYLGVPGLFFNEENKYTKQQISDSS
jgi:hypothetical protein